MTASTSPEGSTGSGLDAGNVRANSAGRGGATLASRALALLWILLCGSSLAAERPNVLIILADDCTYNDLPVYGGSNAATPNLDRLAGESLVFDRAYLCEAMCQPSRAALYTGRFPMGNGCAWNHSASRPGVVSMPRHLGALGYRVGLAGKVHVAPREVFPFETVGGFDPDCVGNPTRKHDLGPARAFMTREPDTPFCLVVALVEPHVPWVMGDASAYPPESIDLPPHLADTPATREAYGRYLAEITYMDGQVGDLLACLDTGGLADRTLVLFSSEQGAQFPGCKWTNYDLGLHTALIARWPGQAPSGERTRAIVQWVDVLPTLLDAAAGAPVEGLDGRSFLEVLRGRRATHRDVAYGVHNNLPEGPAYPVRTVTDGTYRYIRNLSPGNLYIEKHLMGWNGDGSLNNPYWSSWLGDSLDANTLFLVKRYMSRPAEELYHTAADPFELENLAADPAYDGIKQALSDRLDVWLKQQGDPGRSMDTPEALQASRRGKPLY